MPLLNFDSESSSRACPAHRGFYPFTQRTSASPTSLISSILLARYLRFTKLSLLQGTWLKTLKKSLSITPPRRHPPSKPSPPKQAISFKTSTRSTASQMLRTWKRESAKFLAQSLRSCLKALSLRKVKKALCLMTGYEALLDRSMSSWMRTCKITSNSLCTQEARTHKR